MDNYKIGKLKWVCMLSVIVFLIFVVIDSVYYEYQYSKTYTLCSGLNSVSLYESERTREEIFIRIKGDNMSTF